MRTCTIKYALSKEGQKNDLLAGGSGECGRVVSAELTPEFLAVLANDEINASGEIEIHVNCPVKLRGFYFGGGIFKEATIKDYGKPEIEIKASNIYFDGLQSPEQLRDFVITNRLAALQAAEALKGELESMTAEYNLQMEEKKAEKEADEKRRENWRAERERQEKEAAEQKEKEQEQALVEKSAWISKHGSNHLKKAFFAGYDCQRKYVIERLAIEIPDGRADFDDNLRWKDRSCPSEKMLDLSLELKKAGYDASVKWMTHSLYDNDYCEEYEEEEGVVIEKDLGKYDVVIYNR